MGMHYKGKGGFLSAQAGIAGSLFQAKTRATPTCPTVPFRSGKALCVWIFTYFSSPVNNQSTDLPNSRLMASNTAAHGSLSPCSSAER